MLPNNSLQRTHRQSLRSFLFAAELDIVRQLKPVSCSCDPTRLPPTSYAEVLERCSHSAELASQLNEVAADSSGWSRAYVCPSCGAQYVGEHPFGEQHGGGALCLFLSPVPDSGAWVRAGNSISPHIRAAHEAALFRDGLGPEVGPELCRVPGCSHRHIAQSVMCREHHASMVGQ